MKFIMLQLLLTRRKIPFLFFEKEPKTYVHTLYLNPVLRFYDVTVINTIVPIVNANIIGNYVKLAWHNRKTKYFRVWPGFKS